MPGFGIKRIIFGNNKINIKGNEKPNPKQIKIYICVIYDCVNATAIALPINGEEQGVETTQANTPFMKLFKNGFCVHC